MTREEFIQVLDKEGYSYKIEGDNIVVAGKIDVNLNSLKTLPPGAEFNNGGHVYLKSLEELPPDVVFKNGGWVSLDSLKELPPGVEFKNGGYVYLNSLKKIPPGVVFKNGYGVYLDSLIEGYFEEWNGNIDGIDSNRLLNGMIKRGVFI